MSNPNPLLANLKLPGRSFNLPSRGALYTNGEVSQPDGEIHVQAMSALDEISLKNSDQLFSGEALDAVVAACIPNIKKPQDLFARDVDALMVFLRLVTYGPEFTIRVTHDCEQSILPKPPGADPEGEVHHAEHTHTINIEEFAQTMPLLDPTDVTERYRINIGEQVVQVQPVRFKDMIELFQTNLKRINAQTAPTMDEIKENLVKSLSIYIHDVDGVKDRAQIQEWVRKLTTIQQTEITDAISHTNAWGPVSTTQVTCPHCKESITVELPLNPVSFFTA